MLIDLCIEHCECAEECLYFKPLGNAFAVIPILYPFRNGQRSKRHADKKALFTVFYAGNTAEKYNPT
jgi:hypothetical protein